MKAPKNLQLNKGVSFKPRVKHKTVWTFYTAISVFFLVGVAIIIFAGPEAFAAGATMMGFVGFMFLLIWLQTSGITIKYIVHPKGLYLKRSWVKHLYPYDVIQAVLIINETEVESIAQGVDDERVGATNEMDVIGAFKGQMDFGRLIQYSSIQFVGMETRGSGHRIHSSTINTDGEFLLLVLKNGSKHFISPLDLQGMLSELERQSKGLLIPYSDRDHALISKIPVEDNTTE